MLKRLIPKIMVALLAAWLFASGLIDFVVVPSIFRNIKSFFEAGDLGILLFEKFNSAELVISSLLIILSSVHPKKKIDLIISSILWIIVMIYFSYLTPKISQLTQLWKGSEVTGALGNGNIPDIQQAHQFYHRLYVGLDTFKMLVLLTFLTLKIKRVEE